MSWREVKLADLCSDFKYGKMPPKEAIVEEGYPIFSGYRITGYARQYLYEEAQLVLVARGVGGTGDVKISPPFSWITNLSIVLSLDNEAADKSFMFYKLGLEPLKERLNTGAAQAQITIENLKPYRVKIPDLPTQKRIASILSAYDGLIENNRRRIALLEQAARLLYREWFVHFRFPGHETASFVDGLPEGWIDLTFDNVCQTIGGGTPSTKVSAYWDEGEVSWVTPTDVTRNDCLALLESEKKITLEGLKKSSAKMLPPYTILMTSRASVGFFGIFDKEVCTNQGFINIIPNEERVRYYLLLNLLNRVEEIRSHAGGSTYAEISKSKFRNLQVVRPDNETLEAFHLKAKPLFDQVRLLKRSIQRLSNARDLLLPRLMDGRLSVDEATAA
ncbi:MAG: restriction endonuclease subunit S [Alphaproteobacteria bacterium]|nr:restriction endonuclease subunit S [Alphaproteobacteria bacterium]